MKKFLMCRPEYYDVNYTINPWMKPNKQSINLSRAKNQWQHLYSTLSLFSEIRLIDQICNCPDMVFTANAGLLEKATNTIFLSSFAKDQRKEEEYYYYKWFRNSGYNIYQPNVDFEGEGDIILKSISVPGSSIDCFFQGYGYRTKKEIDLPLYKIENKFYYKLKLIDERFYHLDTCLSDVCWYPEAFSTKSQNIIRKYFPDSIEVTEEEALSFCCNNIKIGNNIFIPECSTISYKLKEKGYKVYQFDMSEFIKSGGACKCLVMSL